MSLAAFARASRGMSGVPEDCVSSLTGVGADKKSWKMCLTALERWMGIVESFVVTGARNHLGHWGCTRDINNGRS